MFSCPGHEDRSEVLVSYSYFEKDTVQRDNAEFFWKLGMGVNSHVKPPQHTSFVVVVNGEKCRWVPLGRH